MYPEDSVQFVLDTEWWQENEGSDPCRGSLVFAFVPHVDQTPYTFEPIGRKEAGRHDAAEVEVKPLRANAPLKQTTLPVAAMPLHHNEVWAAYRAKKRPCIILGDNMSNVAKGLTRGKPKWQTAPTLIVAPYYGVEQNNQRSGYAPQFVEAVRHCEYAQFFWDKLPMENGVESILRFDHIQPIGAHHNAYSMTGYCLSEDALSVMDNMIEWLVFGNVQEDSLLALYRSEIEEAL